MDNPQTSRGTSVERAPSPRKKVIRLTPYDRTAKHPTSLRWAINAYCYQCQGEDHDPGVINRIRNCEIASCALHPVRPYQQDEVAEVVT